MTYPEYLDEYTEASTRQEQAMTKNTTKKAAASKTAEPQPMEASKVPPAKVGTPATNNQRVCWAAKTLVAEFTEMFPETPVEYSNPDGRNTMLDVTFDLTALTAYEDRDASWALLSLVETDARVAEVVLEDDTVLVSFRASARTQDSRESFGLGDAWDVLTDGSVFDDFEVESPSPRVRDYSAEAAAFRARELGRPVSLGFLTDGGSL